MSASTRIDSSKGPVVTNNSSGISFSRDAGNAGFGPFKADSVPALTGTVTLDNSYAGVCTLSGSAGAITVTLPKASTVPGLKFIFRTLSADAHVLTASQEVVGNQRIVNGNSTTRGSKLTFPTVTGSSVILESDGFNFLVTATSGAMTYGGT